MWKLKWCIDRVVQSVFLEWSLCYLVSFQAPFSFICLQWLHGYVWQRNVLWPLDCTCRPLWLSIHNAGPIHVGQVHQELHHGNGSKHQWWMNLVKQRWHCGRFLCYVPLLVFGRVWGRCLCNCHLDCSCVLDLITSAVNFDFSVSEVQNLWGINWNILMFCVIIDD